MKKTFIISIFILMIMSSCSMGVKEKMGFAVKDTLILLVSKIVRIFGKEEMGFATRDKLNLQMADKIVAFINDSDVNGLYNLFSEEVKENNSKLNSDVKLLIDYLDESIDSYEEWAVGSKTSVEYGKNSTVYYSRFTMKVNNVDYFLHYIYYPKNDFDANREGIRTIKVHKFDDNDTYLRDWEHSREGIIIPELDLQ